MVSDTVELGTPTRDDENRHILCFQRYELAGDHTRSVESMERAVSLANGSSETLAALGHALALGGRAPETEAILKRLLERSKERYVSQALIAQVLIGLGRTEDALDRLEDATQARATDLIWIGVRPVYEPLKASPRFRAIAAKLGIPLD